MLAICAFTDTPILLRFAAVNYRICFNFNFKAIFLYAAKAEGVLALLRAPCLCSLYSPFDCAQPHLSHTASLFQSDHLRMVSVAIGSSREGGRP